MPLPPSRSPSARRADAPLPLHPPSFRLDLLDEEDTAPTAIPVAGLFDDDSDEREAFREMVDDPPTAPTMDTAPLVARWARPAPLEPLPPARRRPHPLGTMALALVATSAVTVGLLWAAGLAW